ncbi:MAG: hypothetical protein LIP12_17460 [Clostridiales bacterium]|nr:hypothetical protein [Clostridiales bacterium]
MSKKRKTGGGKLPEKFAQEPLNESFEGLDMAENKMEENEELKITATGVGSSENNIPEDLKEAVEIEGREADIESETEAAELAERESEGSDSDRNIKSVLYQWRQWLIGALLIVLAAVYLLGNSSKNSETSLERQTEESVAESETAETAKTIRVTGTGESAKNDVSVNEAADTESAVNQSDEENAGGSGFDTESENETEDWQETIFGDSENTVLLSIRVSGLTETQKEKYGFRESGFLTALSSFLTENGLTGVGEVVFENEISCSSENACVFTASLDDYENSLIVIMYPDYPGQYILMLQDLQEYTEGTNEDTESMTQTESTADEQAQDAVEIQSGQTFAQTERSYDATTLSVTGIPATLANYLSNRYELQYTLYDYLYRNGYSNVTATEVISYEIDADTWTATIYFTLSDGSSLTGTYSLDENSYSYQ